jgi:hypothetical protein
MGGQGVFGYILGKKKRYMHVQFDANMLYDILIREIYILIKHFGNIEKLKEEFNKIKNCNKIPTKEIIDKTKYYTNLNVGNKSTSDWYCLLRNCQLSFINIIDCGYILNCHSNYGYIFTLNFNKNKIEFKNKNEIIQDHDIYDVLKMENMPQITYDEIINEVKLEYNIIKEKIDEIRNKLNKIIIEYPRINEFIITKKYIASDNQEVVNMIEKKILYDEYNYEIMSLLNYSYDLNKRFKVLLLQ